jgi:hypothetical protein
MARWTSNDKALTIKRCYFERSGEAHGRSHHCNIDLALLQAGGELFGTPFDDAQTDIGAAHLEFRKKTREAAGTNRAHDPCDQLRLGRERLSFRLPRDLTQAGHDLLKPRTQQFSEIGKMREVSLPPKELAADFVLELADGAAQGRLSHPAGIGSAGEIQRLTYGQKIADLLEFHVMDRNSTARS